MRIFDVPVGLLRSLPQPLEPLVHDGLLRQSTESPAVPAKSESRRLAQGPDLAHERSGPAESHRGDLRQYAQRRFFGPASAQVEADRAVDARELLFGESFLAQRGKSVLVGLAAADRADIADVFAKYGAQGGQVEL